MNPFAISRRLSTLDVPPPDLCRLLLDSVTDYAIFMLDASGHVTTWNAGAERAYGYKADEIVGEHVARLYVPEDVASGEPARDLEKTAELGGVEVEAWRLRADGARFRANIVTTALRDEHGNLRGYARVTRDLTEKDAAQAQLRQSEQRFHDLVDAVTDYAIFMLTPSGHVASWNEGARRTKGYMEAEIIGRHFSTFYTAEDRAAGKPERILEAVRRDGRVEDESWRVRKDGSRFWANVVITAVRDDNGRVVGFAKVTRDLSDRRRIEEELRRSEERFRILVDGVVDYAIYMLDPEGKVSTWNAGAERMKGYTATEILGKSFAAFFPDDDVRAQKPARELESARVHGHYEDEGWRIRKDGSRFWAHAVLRALRDAQGDLIGFAKVTRDLTNRQKAEESERKLIREQAARAAADEANRLKDEFLATVSHELRTPLNAILGWSAMLLRTGGPGAPPPRGIEVIHRNAQAQARIIEDILDVSRIMTGKLRLDLGVVDLVAVVAEAIETVRPSAAAKSLAIEFTAEEPASLVGDPERLRQIAWNLLSNAVKFTDPGGIVRVAIAREGAQLALTVSDSGRGIEPDLLPYVFDRFKQADSSTTRRHGGLGLGLAIVRQMAELHGGTVRAESAGAGQGAAFHVVLPIRAVAPEELREEARTANPSRPSKPDRRSLQGVRILVVDDDPDARELLHDVLVEAGAVVETEASASEGFASVRRFRPDVLVSDVGMPEEDGYSLVRRTNALDPAEGGGVPSVALTAYTRNEDRRKAIAAGFTTHVGKPVDPDDLVAALANVVALTRR